MQPAAVTQPKALAEAPLKLAAEMAWYYDTYDEQACCEVSMAIEQCKLHTAQSKGLKAKPRKAKVARAPYLCDRPSRRILYP